MSLTLKGTMTEQNLLKSFAGESQARNRYEFFESVARKEGYEQIANIFEETATQEKAHAKRFFKFLEGGMTEITASYPAGKIEQRGFIDSSDIHTRAPVPCGRLSFRGIPPACPCSTGLPA